jgi:pimeloyl-ACP methyl ester carboxylesterase
MRQAPERVVKLALLDTTARPDAPETTATRRATIARAEAGEFAAVLAESAKALLHPAHREDRRLIETSMRMGLAVGLDGFRRQTEAIIARPDSRPGLAAIRVPTLVLVGDGDPLTPPDRSEEIAAGIAGARLVVIPDCGHNSTHEQPDLVTRALIEWIAG